MKHRVHTKIPRPDSALIERYNNIYVETVAAVCSGKPWFVDPAIKPLAGRQWRVCGPAVTALPSNTDTMASIIASGVAEAGDVIVVAAGGDCSAGVWGQGTSISARNRRAAGAVVDGAIIDSRSIVESDWPVFARGANMRHEVAALPGSVNIDIEFGGVKVSPGDIVLGDMDGILVVPLAEARTIIELAEARYAQLLEAKEKLVPPKTLLDLRGGRPMIEELGVKWIDR